MVILVQLVERSFLKLLIHEFTFKLWLKLAVSTIASIVPFRVELVNFVILMTFETTC